jgi:hypothetical protein
MVDGPDSVQGYMKPDCPQCFRQSFEKGSEGIE